MKLFLTCIAQDDDFQQNFFSSSTHFLLTNESKEDIVTNQITG
jgi:hypothetical protein